MSGNFLRIVIERLLDGFDLRFSVHVQGFLPQTLLHVETDLGFNLFHCLRLEPSLFRRNVFRLPQPGYRFGMPTATERILRRVDIFFQQFLIRRIQLSQMIDLVQVPVDQINSHSQIVLGQHFVAIIPLQRGRLVLDKPIILKRIRNELQIERNIRQGIAVLDPADQFGSGESIQKNQSSRRTSNANTGLTFFPADEPLRRVCPGHLCRSELLGPLCLVSD